jgi:CYTH domain-containing protein
VDLDGGRVAEVDLYAGSLAGLRIVEVEFASADDASRFTPPSWFGSEVTGDRRWTNAELARHGAPPHGDPSREDVEP